jgi:hypothetical protein
MEKIGVPTDSKSHFYFIILMAFLSLLGWFIFTFYKATIVDVGCSEIAQNSVFNYSKRFELDPSYDYDYIKAVCIDESLR